MVMTREELGRLVHESVFLEPFGMTLEACGERECTLRLPHAAWLERPGGVINGIAIMGVADVAMWIAIIATHGAAEKWVTVDMKTSFLAGARSDVLCTAKVLSISSRRAYGTAECRGVDGTLIAHHVITYALAS